MKNKLLKILLNSGLIISLVIFILSFLYYCNGSLEMYPTDEQQEKGQIVSSMFMLMSGGFCVLLYIFKVKSNKRTGTKQKKH